MDQKTATLVTALATKGEPFLALKAIETIGNSIKEAANPHKFFNEASQFFIAHLVDKGLDLVELLRKEIKTAPQIEQLASFVVHKALGIPHHVEQKIRSRKIKNLKVPHMELSKNLISEAKKIGDDFPSYDGGDIRTMRNRYEYLIYHIAHNLFLKARNASKTEKGFLEVTYNPFSNVAGTSRHYYISEPAQHGWRLRKQVHEVRVAKGTKMYLKSFYLWVQDGREVLISADQYPRGGAYRIRVGKWGKSINPQRLKTILSTLDEYHKRPLSYQQPDPEEPLQVPPMWNNKDTRKMLPAGTRSRMEVMIPDDGTLEEQQVKKFLEDKKIKVYSVVRV